MNIPGKTDTRLKVTTCIILACLLLQPAVSEFATEVTYTSPNFRDIDTDEVVTKIELDGPDDTQYLMVLTNNPITKRGDLVLYHITSGFEMRS
jgi:hypothetical protein